jgi:L-iditol 2-dehydrogenase
MKALILKAYNQLVYEECPEPAIETGEVLVRVAACGICGSDVHGVDGSTGRRVPPIIMGHEAAGSIVACGPGVQGWHVGERVTFGCVIHCAHCYYCRRGELELCENRRWLGVSIPGLRKHGAFAEYVAVPQQILFRVPDELSFVRAAMMEPLTIAAHALARTSPAPHDMAVVVGSGMIGLLVVQLLKLAGARHIVAVDIDDRRLELAGRFGATHLLRSDRHDVPAAVRSLSHGRGADVVFEAVGAAPTVALAIACARKGGSLTLIGNLASKVEVPLQEIVIGELTLRGTTNASSEWDACLEMVSSGAVEVDALISAVAPLSEGAEWFSRLRQPVAGHRPEAGLMKIILQPGL